MAESIIFKGYLLTCFVALTAYIKLYFSPRTDMVIWLSGNVVGHINKVTLRQAS